MNTDCSFKIGSTHKVCQDYARATEDAVVLADGCSGSPDSDFGSRLLCSAALGFLSRFPQQDGLFHNNVIAYASGIAKIMDLHPDALNATLLVANCISRSRAAALGVYVSSAGDGVIIARKRGTQQFTITVQSYDDEYPFYLNYFLHPSTYNSYQLEGHGVRVRRVYEFDLKGEEPDLVEETSSSDAVDCLFFDEKQFDLIAIVSDGFKSFFKRKISDTSRSSVPVDLFKIFMRLLIFKHFKGSFVDLRMNRFLSDCVKDGIFHVDDISVGAIYLGD
jgi:hypothetical protein